MVAVAGMQVSVALVIVPELELELLDEPVPPEVPELDDPVPPLVLELELDELDELELRPELELELEPFPPLLELFPEELDDDDEEFEDGLPASSNGGFDGLEHPA